MSLVAMYAIMSLTYPTQVKYLYQSFGSLGLVHIVLRLIINLASGRLSKHGKPLNLEIYHEPDDGVS